MQVAKPNLNRGLSAGLKQESFGNFRDSNFKFPTGLSAAQPPPTRMTQPRFTYKYAILPTEGNWDMRWDTGTILMIKKDTNALKQMYCLSYARTLMAQSAIAQHLANKKRAISGTSAPSENDNTIQLGKNRPKARDYNFMADMESIAENLDFAGIGIGPVEPGLQIGSADMTSSAKYSGHSKQVPLVVEGNCFIPNLWECELRAGQDLYIGIKPRKPGKKFYNQLGEPLQISDDIKDTDLIPDFFFYTHPSNKPPPRCSNLSVLLEGKGDQPALTDRCYIEWTVDQSTGEMTGELKDGIVWKIGRVYRGETGRSVVGGTSRFNEKPQEPLTFTKDYRTYPLIEIALDPKRVY